MQIRVIEVGGCGGCGYEHERAQIAQLNSVPIPLMRIRHFFQASIDDSYTHLYSFSPKQWIIGNFTQKISVIGKNINKMRCHFSWTSRARTQRGKIFVACQEIVYGASILSKIITPVIHCEFPAVGRCIWANTTREISATNKYRYVMQIVRGSSV